MSAVSHPTQNAIVLKQEPVIVYDLIENIGKEVQVQIESLNLETIEATEENLKVLKTTRTDLKKQFEVFENQRKMVKELIMKPYNDFDEKYKEHIANLFKDAEVQLKEKVNLVDDGILTLKIDGIKEYFSEANQHDFISFDDLGLKIIKSKSDKSIKDEIDAYLQGVENDLNTIKTLENSDRILAKYQASKDLNSAISETNMEAQREEQIKKQKEEAEQRKKEFEARQKEDLKKELQTEYDAQIQEDGEELTKEPIQEPKVYRSTFTVTATKEQLQKLKQFMQSEEIIYE